MTTSEREVVAALGPAIASRIGEPRFQLWFADHTRFRWQDGLLQVGVPNLYYQEWLQTRYAETVRAAASAVAGRPVEVRFVIDPELFQAARRAQAESAPPAETRRPADTETGSDTQKRIEPVAQATRRGGAAPQRQWRRLSEFVVGPCNRLAHASAVSVVELPGQGANPLVLHGPVGTGKSHLLEGIRWGLRKGHPDWLMRFVTAEEFTNQFLQAFRANHLGAFRKRFRDCDALFVDDLHFLASKRATQEEFLHTFDVLLTNGKQVVVSCDCHPKLSADFSPELTDRLLGGAVWGLLPPDADTRLTLLRAKAARGEPPIAEEVLHLLAGQLHGNVRELEGALHSVRHFSRVAGRPIDVALAREALGDLLRHSVRVVQLADVDRAVCTVLRLAGGALQSKQRAWAVSHPRMVAMYLARKHTAAAHSEIGQHFGNRNHSTVVAAEKKVRQWLQENGDLVLRERRLRIREVVELIERELHR